MELIEMPKNLATNELIDRSIMLEIFFKNYFMQKGFVLTKLNPCFYYEERNKILLEVSLELRNPSDIPEIILKAIG